MIARRKNTSSLIRDSKLDAEFDPDSKPANTTDPAGAISFLDILPLLLRRRKEVAFIAPPIFIIASFARGGRGIGDCIFVLLPI